jgi:16S rRNA (cytidine1402-2'-O)-methyltransferase
VTGGRSGQLFVVSTPIGNMGDFSFRAVEVLQSVSRILAEDTRHTRHLLDRYGISAPMLAYHEHNEARSTPGVISTLLGGEDVALVSDAGTPLVSDPGARLIEAAIEAGIDVVPIPGASALLAALVASGIGAERFTFFGFLPRKGVARASAIAELSEIRHTAILYESPSRLGATLAELAAAGLESRRAAVARELTKKFEEVRRGTVEELAEYYRATSTRGEVVLVLAGAARAEHAPDDVRARARTFLDDGCTVRDAAARLVSELGVSRNVAYRTAREVDEESKPGIDQP